MQNYVHKMLRVHPDTFNATVNTVVMITERNTQKEMDDKHICQIADLTNISIHDNYEHFVEVLNLTKGVDFESVKSNISNNEYAIYFYPQALIKTNSNLPFFVASPKLFALMNDNSKDLKRELKEIGGKQVQVRKIAINDKEIKLVKLGDIAEIKVGLQTGDNNAYLFQKPEARGNYRSIEDYIHFVLTEADLDKIRDDDKLRMELITKGISKSNSKTKRYFDGKYIIPYDKGGESDSDSGWLPNFFVAAQYYIDWSEKCADALINEKLLYSTSTRPYPRNQSYYFLKGISFSDTGEYSPTYRLNFSSVFDQKGSTVVSLIKSEILLGIISSKLMKYFMRTNINHTVSSHVDCQKELVIIQPINIQIEKIVGQIIKKQKTNPRYDYASHEQIDIDKLVYEAYGLNAEDVQEVENWFARRYAKLSAAHKANLRALGKSDDYLELYGLK
jgi:hypothetical protein